jgi:CHAD domain-containing protein
MLRERGAAVMEQDPRVEATSDLHEVRIRLKRFRYSWEFSQRLEAQDAGDMGAAMVHMQELLGRWNDDLAAAAIVSRVARRRRYLSMQTLWSARLLDYAAERARGARRHHAQILEEWPALDKMLCDTIVPRPAVDQPEAAIQSQSPGEPDHG